MKGYTWDQISLQYDVKSAAQCSRTPHQFLDSFLPTSAYTKSASSKPFIMPLHSFTLQMVQVPVSRKWLYGC